ncbi:UvrB/UvrC motif-containing protein [Fictibacillus sp. KIGAM418]|uniref:UvrB/UvrC motif-containing protein n=1 Tax=Fictibacillus marinisediminis TaxID=2878389 RepID=A0A9X2BAS3_9BACL|nr:UvrB/UvrC motif-containing protein [Fictibacillus marinisediminis]MCK6255159.1 UvrB/UvrC motif-containing protein [Fictibacillus marinisediminis]
MFCQECHERPATLHFTKIVNGKKTEFHICEHCAKEKGEFLPGSNTFSIHQLLSGLLYGDPSISGTASSGLSQQSVLACPQCGMTYNQFAKSGRFGCSHCYEVFDSKLDPILKRVHGGNTRHAGKIPKRIGSGLQEKRELEKLKQAMQQYILNEEFEKAAETRDQIRLLEKQKHREKGE